MKTEIQKNKVSKNKMETDIHIRATMEEKYILKQKGKQFDIPYTTMMKKFALEGKVEVVTISEEDNKIMRALYSESNNLNQLTKLAHLSSLPEMAVEIQMVVNKLKQFINKIEHTHAK